MVAESHAISTLANIDRAKAQIRATAVFRAAGKPCPAHARTMKLPAGAHVRSNYGRRVIEELADLDEGGSATKLAASAV